MKRNLTARLRSTRTNYPPSLIVVIQARTYYDLQAPFYTWTDDRCSTTFSLLRQRGARTARCRKIVNYSNRKRLMDRGDTD